MNKPLAYSIVIQDIEKILNESQDNLKASRVIGNIYENPELLQKESE